MKKLLLTIMVIGLVGLTGCGAVNTTEEKTETNQVEVVETECKTEIDSLCEQTVEETNELIDEVESIYLSEESLEDYKQYCTEEEWEEFMLMYEYFN